MDEFSFRRDFKRIRWKETLQVNALRAFAAGIVWAFICLFIMIGDPKTGTGLTYGQLFLLPIGTVAGYLAIYMPLGIFFSFLSSMGIPLVGFVAALFALIVAVGDPVMFIIHKVKPGLVPVKDYSFICFRLIIFVLDMENTNS